MFIRKIDLENEIIEYEIRDKNDGKLIESVHKSHIEFFPDKICFDNRHIDLNLLKYIMGILN